MFYRIEDDSCCWWRHSAVSGCFQSEVNWRDTFSVVLESCTAGPSLSLSFCRVWTHSRRNPDSVVRTSQFDSTWLGTLFRKYQSCSNLWCISTLSAHPWQWVYERTRDKTGSSCRLCSWYSQSHSYSGYVSAKAYALNRTQCHMSLYSVGSPKWNPVWNRNLLLHDWTATLWYDLQFHQAGHECPNFQVL